MRILIIIGLLTLGLCRLVDKTLVTREHIKELKKVASFEVYDYEEHPFKDLTDQELKMKLGLLGLTMNELSTLPMGDVSKLPENFSAKLKWPQCIHNIRDQQQCGSCWAFAASEVLSDRFCISSKGKVNVVLSPQDMVSCDSKDFGCQGGYLDKSWDYLVSTGIVSDDCFPYTAGQGESGKCLLDEGKCIDGSKIKKYKAKNYKTYNSVEEIKKDIMKHGPIETGFMVYQDFMSYRSGIYKKTSDVFLGGHAVKVIGWGLEKETNTHYWIVANSWGLRWGEDGFFRIEIGNCCNFESSMIAGSPKLDKTQNAGTNFNMLIE